MRDVLPTLARWEEEGRRFATATVTHTWGSSPRPLGSVMGVREDGFVCGSVSGGCVESAVIETALSAIGDGKPRELVFSGLSEGQIWDVGLSCGGKIQVWIDPEPTSRNPSLWRDLRFRIESDQPSVLVTRLDPFEQSLWIPSSASGALTAEAEEAYRSRQSLEIEKDGQRYFLQVLPCRERLVIVGAVHIAAPLVKFAKELGFETVVIDPRSSFADSERFPTAPDRLIAAWPQEALAEIAITDETYAVVLTHDPKIDDAALSLFLRSPAAYIGALGSRTTQAKRREDLMASGFSPSELDRIHGPIGLTIGARSPEEIAISILAEIVQIRNRLR